MSLLLCYTSERHKKKVHENNAALTIKQKQLGNFTLTKTKNEEK